MTPRLVQAFATAAENFFSGANGVRACLSDTNSTAHSRPIPRTSPRRRPAEADERPFLDEVEFIEDDDEDEEVEEVEAPARRRPKAAARAPRREKKPPLAKDLDYIPLDDL